MKNNKTFGQVAALIFALTLTAPALAGIVITGTRVIYPEGEREVMVKVENKGDKPVLIQSWVDDGDAEASPETTKAPFFFLVKIGSNCQPKKLFCSFLLAFQCFQYNYRSN